MKIFAPFMSSTDVLCHLAAGRGLSHVLSYRRG